jgi:hypothetical protein
MRRGLLLIACLLLWAVPAQAQVAYETSLTPVSVVWLAAGETETVAFDFGSGANRVALAFATWRDEDPAMDTTAATINGVAMASSGAKVTQGVNTIAGHLYCLAGPASGTVNLAITMSASAGSNNAGQITAWVANTVDQTTPCDGYVAANGTSALANVVSASGTITSATNDRIVTFHATQNFSGSIAATPTNFTERQDTADGGGYSIELGDAAGAATVTPSATWSNGAFTVNWIAVGININVVAGGSTCGQGLTLLGAGKCD